MIQELTSLTLLLCFCAGLNADDTTLLIELKGVPKNAKIVHHLHPRNYAGFEKQLKKLEGKPVLDLLGKKLSIQLQKNYQPKSKPKPYSGADFICAILRGKIISDKEMRYALQQAEECVVTTPKGRFIIGIYYRPVAYILLPNKECYWFTFEDKAR